MSTILCTYWLRATLRCVLVEEDGGLAIQVWIEDRPFLTERVLDALGAAKRAEALYGVLCSEPR